MATQYEISRSVSWRDEEYSNKHFEKPQYWCSETNNDYGDYNT